MKDIAQQLRAIITATEPKLLRMQDENVKFKPAASEWSKKEILGHLIDSAANNHPRFVRAVYGAAAQFPTHDPEEWVGIQCCNDMPLPSADQTPGREEKCTDGFATIQ